PAKNHRPLIAKAENVFRKQAHGALPPAAHCGGRMCSGGKYLFVARANHLRAVRANDQRLHLSQPMAPLSAHAQSLGGNMLKINQRLAVPVSGDGRKTLVIRLSIAVST